MVRHILAALVLLLVGGAQTLAQECLHGRSETTAQKTRREQALKVAQQINVAQTTIVGPKTPQSKYRSLKDLTNVPPVPPGFRIQFYTDGETYTLSIKDATDPCHYAIFSDQAKLIYEATPRVTPMTLPAISY